LLVPQVHLLLGGAQGDLEHVRELQRA
jgi:hypothetical protein